MAHKFILACLLLSSCLVVPVRAQKPPAPPVRRAANIAPLLPGLVDRPGISGFETETREAIRRQLPAWAKSRVDEAGNLIVTVGQGHPHVLVCADMDEDGYFVSAITDEGYLRLHRVTTGVTNRLFEQMHYGQPIFIQTQSGKHVPGVIATASSHLQRGRDQSAAPKGLDDLWVDVGAASRGEVERLGIQLLDPISLRERVQVLRGRGLAVLGQQLAGVDAQARAMDYGLADFVATLDAGSVTGTLIVAWTAQGSFGERGMARLARELTPDRVIVFARTPMPRDGNNPKGAVGTLGRGVLVSDADKQAIESGKQHDVLMQPVAGVPPVPRAWPADRTQVFSIPVLYAQTPVETVDATDVEQVGPLLRAVLGYKEISTAGPPGVAGGIVGGIPAGIPSVIDVLRRLVGAPAVSGAERPVREIVLRSLPKWAKPEVDDHGNVTVTFGGGQPASAAPAGAGATAAGKELLFVAHMDEVGYAITDIRDDGTASVVKRGGFFDYLWEAHPVFVQTAKALVPAIVAPRPGYLSATTATARPEDLSLYFGTASRDETLALGVAKGDTATIHKQLTPLAGSRWTARSMDDRCGVAALISALNRLDPATVPNRVTFAFVVGEETGLEGSGFLAERLHPAVAFAVDTFVSSDSPVDPQRLALVPLGSGAVARVIDNSSITPPETVSRIVSIGRAHQIPVVPSATSGGNDGSQFSRYGSIVAPLSWPGRYSHSPVEVMDLRDLENLVGLVVALAQEF